MLCSSKLGTKQQFKRRKHAEAGNSGCVLCGFVITHAVAREDGGSLYEIYKHWGAFTLDAPPPEMKPIVLQVPRVRLWEQRKSDTRLGVQYPNVLPKFHEPKGAGKQCIWLGLPGRLQRAHIDCGEQQSALHNSGRFDAPNMGDYIARVNLELLRPLGAKKDDLEVLHGFDSGYEVRIPASYGIGDRSEQYLFHFGPDKKHYDLAAKCSLNEFARTCTLHFSLRCNPAIYVQVVAIDMKHIDAWKDIVQRTDQFVSSMVRDPACT
jgi:hypothetical protein